MKKIIAALICTNIFAIHAMAFEEALVDDFAQRTLDKNLKITQTSKEPIIDEFVLKNLNPNLKIKQVEYIPIIDSVALKNLNPDLKITKQPVVPIIDNTAPRIALATTSKTTIDYDFQTPHKAIISPERYYSSKTLKEGEQVDFVLAQDVIINDKNYKKGTHLKAKIINISQNKAYGTPAEMTVENFVLQNAINLEGRLELQGANRSVWVYPCAYCLVWFFGLGLLFLPIRGGHAKLKPSKTYEIFL